MITYTSSKYEQTENLKMNEYPHFHISGTTFSKNDKNIEINEELLQKYQEIAMYLEFRKKESKKKKEHIPSYAKLEVITLILFSIFSFIFALITGFIGNIPMFTYFLIIALGCLIGFLPLLYAISKVD